MNLFEQVFNEVVTPFLEPRIKKTSIKAVKGYVSGVQVTRKVTIAAFGISTVAAILVAGILLMVIAVLGLLPIEPRTALISMLVLGAVLTLAAALVTRAGFKESAWLEKSKATDLIEAALKPWPTAYSVPDPRAIFARNPDGEPVESKSSMAARTAMSNAHDGVDGRAPQAIYPTFNTPDASMTTRAIETTSPLHQ